MGLFNGILDDIQFKGGKTNVFLKWIIGLAVAGIIIAFGIGEYKSNHIDKLNHLKSLTKKGIDKTKQLEEKVENQNSKIDKIYNDGIEAFDEYRKFNNQQLKLIIEYGRDNKELLKKMIDINSKEKAVEIRNKLNISKRKRIDSTSSILPLNISKVDTFKTINLESLRPNTTIFTKVESTNNIDNGRKTYYVINAPKNYLDTLDLNKYKIIKKEKSNLYNSLYNFIYREKY